MKKIMFNDRYGLTEAVLSGRKTQTRRIITCPKTIKGQDVCGFNVYIRQSDGSIPFWPCTYDADEATIDGGDILPKYKVGEVVAVAQAYKNIAYGALWDDLEEAYHIPPTKLAGWTNKMFVRADLMPHQIRITNVRVERLNDISEVGCIKEGIIDCSNGIFNQYAFTENPNIPNRIKHSPREAYAALIDKISGKGTWESNPYVFVYDFELVK